MLLQALPEVSDLVADSDYLYGFIDTDGLMVAYYRRLGRIYRMDYPAIDPSDVIVIRVL